MVTRTLSERLTWRPDSYCKSDAPTYAAIDNDSIASLFECPAGYALRIYCIPPREPGATQIYPSIAAALAGMEEWIRGLDIEEWPAP